MQLAVVYDPLDNKMREDTYSYVYRGMFDALVNRFNPVHVTEDCNAKDIDADAILFWDVNSCHHIKIDGIDKHPALKLEYMSDPFQVEQKGEYIRYKMFVHKLGAENRIRRVFDRGVSRIISSNKAGYYRYFSELLNGKADDMLWFFPHAPWFDPGETPISERKPKVLANGSFSNNHIGYDFRFWATKNPLVTYVPHWLIDRSMVMGKGYGEFLKQWAASIALSDFYPVPKYYEIPQAGCLAFMSYHEECEELGFKDYETCVYVTKDNFNERVKHFLFHPDEYQKVADAGRKLVAETYTNKHFAEWLAGKIESEVGNHEGR